ncbi:FxsA family membrane protein [Streptomyces sp. G-G2]|uniref:FxsA family membrane protein n=1 Tax=Streptomyces sp. G-G2 TaxID=3046201 RepID=UPI0024BAA5A3|nr:FxsA family membrane protein [Streptomyces sp. G-G2]MDJ0380924.1 FxsA family membrane protein [Streptomyces sp. G-G2]
MTTGFPTSKARPGAPSAAPRRRSPARTFVPLAVAAWLILEIWLLSLLAGVGGGLAVAAVIAGGLALGVVVIKRAGRRAFQNLAQTFQKAQTGERPAPQQPGSGNGLVMLGGLLLILPGLLSDVLGLLLLLPPVRAWVGRRAARSLERTMASASAGPLGDAFQQARIHQPDGMVVRGEVVREDEVRRPGPDTGHRPPLAP